MIELHAHLGGSLSHEQITGLARMFGLKSERQSNNSGSLDSFLAGFHTVERLQSDADFFRACARTAARSFFETGGQHLEMRFCPFVRNLAAELQISILHTELFLAAAEASATFGVRLIGMRGNMEHLDALSGLVKHEAVIGVDIAGPETGVELHEPWLDGVKKLYEAVKSDSKTTSYHTGEASADFTLKLLAALGVSLDRVGHGVALRGGPLESASIHAGLLFELCPAVNAICGVASFREVMQFAEELVARNTAFVICSDNPGMSESLKEQLNRTPQHLRVASHNNGRRWTQRYHQ